jgi:hypothetical protein
MDSEALRTELPRLLAAAAALPAGVTAAIAIRSLMRRGDGGAVRRSVAAMVAASAAIAFGAGFLVYSARLGYLAPLSLVYGAAGFAAGMLCGLFPLQAGAPLFVLAALASTSLVSMLAPTAPWVAGAQAARITVYSSTEMATVCSADIGSPGSLGMERDLTLPSGLITLEMGVFDIRGPFSAAFGRRRYRLDSIAAGGTRTRLGMVGNRLPSPPPATWFLGLMGCRYSMVVSDGFLPEDMLVATLVLEDDGRISLELR